jgi:hypothetical protein
MPRETSARRIALPGALLLVALSCATTDNHYETMRACEDGNASNCPSAAYYAEQSQAPESVVLGYYEKGCAGKDGNSCFLLGYTLAKDTKVPKRLAAAADAQRRGCDLQFMKSCAQLSRAYLHGEGIEKSPAKARAVLRPICARAATISETTTMDDAGDVAYACDELANAWDDLDAKDRDPLRAAKLRIMALHLRFETDAMLDQKLYEIATDAQPKIIASHEAEMERKEDDERHRQTLLAVANGLQQASAQIQASQSAHEQRMAEMNSAIPSTHGSAAAPAGPKAQYKVIPGEKCSDRQVRDPCLAGCGDEDTCETGLSENAIYRWGKCTSQLKIKGKNSNGSLVYALDDPGYRSCVDQCVSSVRQCRNHCPHCAGDRVVTP